MVINTVWVLIASILVFFMQAGFALVESGFTRAKNTANIIMKNFLDFCIGSLLFWIVGYSIMFNEGNLFMGAITLFSNFSIDLPVTQAAFLFFQTVFAGTAVTIISGAVAERMKFGSYIIVSIVITAIVYPISGHWVWGGGFLSQIGFLDFAGSSVVHGLGGFAALAGAMVLGPRIGKFNADGTSNDIAGHSLTLGALGVFILWFGWFGFNPGSTLGVDDIELVSHIFMTTNISAAAGALTALTYSWILTKHANVGATLNGALAGLVGITAGTDVISVPGALMVGIISGIVVVVGMKFIEETLKVDDPVGAVAVHGICGFLGTVLVGVFAQEVGLIYSGSISQLLVQILGASVIGLWGFGTSFAIFSTIKAIIGVRASEEEETLGLDLSEHQVSSYPNFQYIEEV
jgi:Amt family ammonium transporter